MNTLILSQNKRLVIAGLLAFLFLLASQISVQAYEFVGGFNRSVPTIGGNEILVIGRTGAQDTSLNIGRMPTVVTGAASNTPSVLTLNGEATNMGVASSAYVRFNWGYVSGAYDHNTDLQTINGIGTFLANINTFLPQTIYYRTEVIVGAVSSYSAEQSYTPTGSQANGFGLATTIPILALFIILMFIVGLTISEDLSIPIMVVMVIVISLGLAFLQAIQSGIISSFGG